MLYDSYQRKINKIVLFMRKVFRHMVKIVIVASVLLAIGVTVTLAKGMIMGAPVCPPEITYGEAMDFKAEAFLSNVTYEYSVPGSGVWSTEPPSEPGEYVMRAVSTTAFGGKRYSGESSFTLLKKAVEVTVNEKEMVYGDTLTVGADLSAGDTISCTNYHFEGITDAETLVWADDKAIVITDKNGLDVTGSYDITVVESVISVLPRPITVTVEDRNIVYDGVGISFESEFDAYEVNADTPLVDGDAITAMFSGSLIEAGEKSITPEFCIVNKNGIDVTENYVITVIEGKMTVDKRPLQITTGSAEFVYDGRPHTHLDGYTVNETTSEKGLLSGHQIKVNKDGSASVTYAGETVSNRFGVTIVDGFGNDVTQNYAVTFITGDISVAKRNVTIKEQNMSFTYDGKPHSLDDYEYQRLVENLAEGHEVKVTKKPSITDVDSVKNEFELEIWYDGKNVTENYNIQYANGEKHAGYLTVNKRQITVSTADQEWIYNGQPHTGGEYTSVLTADKDKPTPMTGIVSGHTLSFDAKSITNVGEIANEISNLVITDSAGKDVSSNYEVALAEPGTLKVVPRAVTVKTNSAKKTYDGSALTATGFVLSEVADDQSLVESVIDGVEASVTTTGHKLTIRITGAATNVADSGVDNNKAEVVSIIDRDGNAIDLNNYSIHYDFGDLTVERRALSVIAQSLENMYTGQAQTHPYFVVDEGVKAPDNLSELIPVKSDEGWLLETTGQTLTAVMSGSVTNVFDGVNADGKAENKIESVSVKDSAGNEISLDNFDISYVSGSITVSKRVISVIAQSLENMYTAKPQTHPYFVVDEGVMAPENLFEPIPVKSEDGWKLETTGQTLTVTIDGVITNVYDGENEDGSVANTVVEDSILVKDDSGNEIDLRNYDISCVNGYIKIIKRQLTIIAGGLDVKYNGQIRTNGSVTLQERENSGQIRVEAITATGEVGTLNASVTVSSTGHIINVTVTGQQEGVGESDNTFRYIITTDGETPLDEKACENYDITSVSEKLKVGKRVVSITTASDKKNYDSKPLTNGSFEIVEIADNGEEIKHTVKVELDDNGIPQIEKSEAVVSAKIDDSNGYLVAVVKLQTTGHTVTVNVTGKQEGIGGSDNTFTYTLTDDSGEPVDENNYEITLVTGTLNVEKRKISISTVDDSKYYDGKHLTNGSFTIIEIADNGDEIKHTVKVELDENDRPQIEKSEAVVSAEIDGNGYLVAEVELKTTGEIVKITVTGSQKTVGSSENVFTFLIDGEENNSNYDVTTTFGDLEIKHREIKITTEGDKKTYDSKPLTNGKFTLVETLNDGTKNTLTCEATVVNDELVYEVTLESTGETLTVKILGTITNTGNADNQYEVYIDDKKLDKNNAEANYLISDGGIGKLIIEARKIQVSTEGDTKIYDSKPLTNGKFTLVETLNDGTKNTHTCEATVVNDELVYEVTLESTGETLTVKILGTITNTGNADNQYEVYIDDKKLDKNNAEANYLISDGGIGKLIIEARKIQVSTEGDTKIYDSDPLTNGNFTLVETVKDAITQSHECVAQVENGQLVYNVKLATTGETLTIKILGTITDKGTTVNQYEVYIGDKKLDKDNDKANYLISDGEIGELVVTARKIKVSTDSITDQYDGMPLTNGKFTLVEILNDDGSETTSHTYTAMGESGKLAYKFTLGSTGESVTVTVTGTQTVVGASKNDYSITIAGKSENPNYEIETESIGDIEVTKRPVTIITGSSEWTYDGKDHSNNQNWTFAEGSSLAGGHTLTVSKSTTVRDVVKNEPNVFELKDCVITDKAGNDVTANYELTIESTGTLTVKPRRITVVVENATFVYDGQEHSYDVIYVKDIDSGETYYMGENGVAIGSANNEILTATVIAQGKVKTVDDGPYENKVSNAIINGIEDNPNYDVDYINGTIEITPRRIILSIKDVEVTYNGQEHGSPILQIIEINNNGELVYGEFMDVTKGIKLSTTEEMLKAILNVNAGVPVKNVGTYTDVNTVEPSEVEINGVKDNPNYSVEVDPGSITINPLNITLGTNGGKFVYDGKPHSSSILFVRYEHNESFTEIDASKETITLSTGDVLSATVEGKATFVTEEEYSMINRNSISITLNGEDVSKNYEIDYDEGRIEITPRKLYVTTGSAEQIYNGKPLVNNSYTVKESDNGESIDVVDNYLTTTGDTIQVTVIGSQTDVGESKNGIETKFYRNGERISSENYEIATELGTLKVTQRVIEITVTDASKPFDGTPLKPNEFIIVETLDDGTTVIKQMNEILESTGERITYAEFDGEQLEVGESEGDVLYVIINNDYPTVLEDDANANYKLTINPGKLKVTEPKATIGYEDDGENELMYTVYSNGGRVYLKLMSFGNYEKNYWNYAEPYEDRSVIYYPGVIAGASKEDDAIDDDIEWICITPKYSNAPFVIPYFIYEGTDSNHTANDVYSIGDFNDTYFECYHYTAIDKSILDKVDLEGIGLAELESAYREYVYDNYLAIDDETKEYMQGIIDKEGFSLDDPYLIDEIAEFMQVSAGLKYDKNYNRDLDNEENIAVAFMETYKSGVCQHYATAATLLFRTLGIPARYTVGYAVNALSEDDTEVYSDNAHAWVEVYIDGIGWQYVEVTGSDGSNGGSSFGTPDGSKMSFTVIPKDYEGEYNGKVHSPEAIRSNKTLEKLIKMGYSYDIEFGGERSEIGKGTTYIKEFILYDRHKKTVYHYTSELGTVIGADRFNVAFQTGDITVRATIKITIGTESVNYNGKLQQYNYGSFVNNSNFNVKYSLNIGLTNAGKITLADLNFNVYQYLTVESVLDKNSGTYLEIEDIANYVKFEFVDYFQTGGEYVVFCVNTIKFKITTNGSSAYNDGTIAELRNEEYTCTGLPSGYTLEAETNGVLTPDMVGPVENTLSYWIIKDSSGEIVEMWTADGTSILSGNFDANVVCGELSWLYNNQQ